MIVLFRFGLHDVCTYFWGSNSREIAPRIASSLFFHCPFFGAAVPKVLAHVACPFSPADVEDDKVGRLTSCIACAQTTSAERRSSGKAVWISPKETLSR